VAKPFALVTDNHVRHPIIKALRFAGWDVARAVDLFGERNEDEQIFRYAAEQGRVFLTSDAGIHEIAHRWLCEGRTFRMIFWRAEHRRTMSDGDVVREIERLGRKPAAFVYSIEYIKPTR
jgi:hypothetical protein